MATEVKVKVKVKVSGKSEKSEKKSEKKPRKTRKDKGTKRGKKGMTNPRVQTGSIDFRTIGTQQTFGPNLTSLIGTVASLARPIVPFQPSVPQQVSSELIMRQNIPPAQERADVEQNQEETPTTEVRRAMGERIGRLRREEASLFLKGKGMEAKNIQLEEYANKVKSELQTSNEKLIQKEQALDSAKKDFTTQRIYETNSDQGFARIVSQLRGLQYTGDEIKSEIKDVYGGNKDEFREALMRESGLNPDFKDKRKVKTGRGGRERTDYFYNPQKADLQRAQEEEPPQLGQMSPRTKKVIQEAEKAREKSRELVGRISGQNTPVSSPLREETEELEEYFPEDPFAS
jgi:hypothetical protein